MMRHPTVSQSSFPAFVGHAMSYTDKCAREWCNRPCAHIDKDTAVELAKRMNHGSTPRTVAHRVNLPLDGQPFKLPHGWVSRSSCCRSCLKVSRSSCPMDGVWVSKRWTAFWDACNGMLRGARCPRQYGMNGGKRQQSFL